MVYQLTSLLLLTATALAQTAGHSADGQLTVAASQSLGESSDGQVTIPYVTAASSLTSQSPDMVQGYSGFICRRQPAS